MFNFIIIIIAVFAVSLFTSGKYNMISLIIFFRQFNIYLVLVFYRLNQLQLYERSLIIAQHEAIINSKVFTLETSILQTFPVKFYKNHCINDFNSINIDTCVICLEEFVNSDELRILPCYHSFHMKCVDIWLTTKSSKCPLCMKDTVSI